MNPIRSLAPETCPHCGASRSLYIAEDRRLTCRLCGYKAQPVKSPSPAPPGDTPQHNKIPEKSSPIFKRKSAESADPALPPASRKVPRRTNFIISEGISHRDPLTDWARARYSTGLQYVREGKYEEAIQAFYRALDEDRDFLDAHLWIARLTEDAEVRREHLGDVLAQQPNHLEAMREMMILNGQLTEEEAARAADASHDPPMAGVSVPVRVETLQLKCPVCGGELTTDADSRQARCAYCGHSEPLTRPADSGLKSVAMALLKRRGQETLWVVGEHLLQCKSCGAERTLPAKRLAERCPFCGSNYVIQKDALQSFQQPDGVMPFALTEDAAEEAIDEALNSGFERLKRFFVNNRVRRIDLEGIYIPCWLFDTVLQVNRTITDKGSQRDAFGIAHSGLAYRQERLTDMANDVPVYAVKSPPAHLLERLGWADFETIVPYEPALLASYTAEIYTVDFDRASLTARERIGELMRNTHGHDLSGDVQTSVQTFIQQMSYRLVLIPVWMATIIEQDGDLRPCLVHGQTGRVVMGKARRP